MCQIVEYTYLSRIKVILGKRLSTIFLLSELRKILSEDLDN